MKTIGGTLGHNMKFFPKARDALGEVATMLELAPSNTILMPAYCCKEMVEPFLGKCKVIYYSLDNKLQIDWEKLEPMLGDAGALLFAHSFGWPQDFKELQRIPGILKIEDMTQGQLSLYNDGIPAGCYGDISIASLGKCWPISGAVMCRGSDAALKWHYAMDSMFSDDKLKRQENFFALLQGMPKSKNFKPMFDQITSNICPSHLPLTFVDKIRRDMAQDKLGKAGIHAPIHWNIPAPRHFEAEHKLADTILSLPIDSRYGSLEMREILKVLELIA